MQSTYIALILLLLVLLWQRRVQCGGYLALRRMRMKRKAGTSIMGEMNELMQRYIGKDCLVYFGMSGGQVSGVIEDIRDGWMSIQNKSGQVETVSLDYVARIREYPVDKKGRRKGVVID